MHDISKPFSLDVRNYDACNLPPCQSELYQHCLRTRYIANLWRNAYKSDITDLAPTDHGWNENNNKFEFTWFIGNQLPDAHENVVVSPDILGNENDTEDSNDDTQDSGKFLYFYNILATKLLNINNCYGCCRHSAGKNCGWGATIWKFQWRRRRWIVLSKNVKVYIHNNTIDTIFISFHFFNK